VAPCANCPQFYLLNHEAFSARLIARLIAQPLAYLPRQAEVRMGELTNHIDLSKVR
jgi:hypothetical protein